MKIDKIPNEIVLISKTGAMRSVYSTISIEDKTRVISITDNYEEHFKELEPEDPFICQLKLSHVHLSLVSPGHEFLAILVTKVIGEIEQSYISDKRFNELTYTF
jgi:hypothetical protein